MPEAPFDLKSKHPLLPHPEVTRTYQENKFKYDKTVQDLNYERWYNETKKIGKISTGKISILIKQMFRLRRMGQDYIFYDAMLYGTDRTGNRLGFDVRLGLYQKPIFRKRIDQRSDEIISHEIEAKETVYEYEYTPDLFDTLLEQSIEESETSHLSLVVVSPTRNYTIPDIQEFRDGTYQELIEIGRTGKSLSSIRKEQEKEQEKTGQPIVIPNLT